MSFSMIKSVSYLTVNPPPGSIPCDGLPHQKTFTVDIDPNAPPGDIVFALYGDAGHAQCQSLVTVTVELISATLTLNPSSIAAKTNWTGLPNPMSQSIITVTWDPPECAARSSRRRTATWRFRYTWATA